MTIRHYITYPALTALMLSLCTACSSDRQPSALPADDSPELHFTAATVTGTTAAPTRADAADDYADALPAGSRIGVFIYGYKGAESWDISTIQPSNNTTSETWVYQTVGNPVSLSTGKKQSNLTLATMAYHTAAPTYPKQPSDNADCDNVQIFATFPNPTTAAPAVAAAVTPSTESYTFTALLDQRTAANVKASDLMTNDIATYTKAQTDRVSLQLALKHRMARVHVTFVPKAGSDLTAANMPQTYDVIGVYRSVTVNPKAGTVVRNELVAKTTAEDPLKASVDHSFFIAPQDYPAGTLLKFNIRGSGNFRGIEGLTFATSGTVSFEAGKSYEVAVTIDVDHATTTGTITPWTDGGAMTYEEYTDSIL